MGLQGIAQCSGDALALVQVVDVEPVQIAGLVHVAKADDLPCFLGHQSKMGQQRGIEGL